MPHGAHGTRGTHGTHGALRAALRTAYGHTGRGVWRTGAARSARCVWRAWGAAQGAWGVVRAVRCMRHDVRHVAHGPGCAKHRAQRLALPCAALPCPASPACAAMPALPGLRCLALLALRCLSLPCLALSGLPALPAWPACLPCLPCPAQLWGKGRQGERRPFAPVDSSTMNLLSRRLGRSDRV